MKRRAALCAMAWAMAASTIRAQPAGRVRRIGVFMPAKTGPAAFVKSVAESLRPLGWTEGRNFEFVFRDASDVASLDAGAQELAGMHVDAVMTSGTPRTRAMQHATRTVPIVTELADPVVAGLAATLSTPGSNVTGLAFQTQEIVDKQVDMCRLVIHELAQARLFTTPVARTTPEMVQPFEHAAHRAGLAFDASFVSDLDGFARGFSTLRAHKSVAIVQNYMNVVDPQKLAAAAIASRCATFHAQPEFVEKGGLMSYVFRFEDTPQRWAAVLDKVLRGLDPASIPFELPRVTEFVVNKSTARALGIDLTTEIMVRATRVVG